LIGCGKSFRGDFAGVVQSAAECRRRRTQGNAKYECEDGATSGQSGHAGVSLVGLMFVRTVRLSKRMANQKGFMEKCDWGKGLITRVV
jgi:hypothetical protein